MRALDPGGIDVLAADLERFAPRSPPRIIRSSAHSRIRALVSGIGNAYSDEILHAAQLSPLAQTQKLKAAEWERLFAATKKTLIRGSSGSVPRRRGNSPKR